MALRTLDLLKARAEEAAIIGDTAHDIEMAHGAGVPSYAVSYGAHDRRTLEDARPRAVVDRFEELATYLG